ncbi:baeRF3 domain-containing protein [Roseimaritima sediminicola]|uniref:baeRF3 domain-containing protein n=1 Tax=Roseimaritima sediminicola TaxID=2662066 RepID=UPI00129832B6|nr:hypothetical protein [Roseimaritima sediminicola]
MPLSTIENPTRQQLVDLLSHESDISVSLLMRTHQSGRDSTQNPIRFKNLITEAIDRVGDRSDALTGRLQELAKLEHDFTFWQHQAVGFALFVSENGEHAFKLSFAPEEKVVVGSQFYLRSIAAASCGGGDARALALTWDRARMFQCNEHDAFELTSGEFPVTMRELVTPRDPEEQLQYSSQGAPNQGGGGGNVNYHGHGEGEDKIEADRRQYLNKVGKLVADAMLDVEAPLILIATNEVAGHFASNNPQVDVEEVLHASPDGLDDESLKSKLVETAGKITAQSMSDVGERLGSALANQQATTELEQLVPAAVDGRIDTLLLGTDEAQPGRFDAQQRKAEADAGGETDLINLAVRETLRSGGTVLEYQRENPPHAVAAIFRY